jgi:hypothetical protein
MFSILVELRSSFGCLSRSGLRLFSRMDSKFASRIRIPSVPHTNKILKTSFLRRFKKSWNVRRIYCTVQAIWLLRYIGTVLHVKLFVRTVFYDKSENYLNDSFLSFLQVKSETSQRPPQSLDPLKPPPLSPRPQSLSLPRPDTLCLPGPDTLSPSRPSTLFLSRPSTLPLGRPDTITASRPDTLALPNSLSLARPESLTRPSTLSLARPEFAVARPESVVARPESAVARPESAVARPESVVARPDTLSVSRSVTLTVPRPNTLSLARSEGPPSLDVPENLSLPRPNSLRLNHTESSSVSRFQAMSLSLSRPQTLAVPLLNGGGGGEGGGLPARNIEFLGN